MEKEYYPAMPIRQFALDKDDRLIILDSYGRLFKQGYELVQTGSTTIQVDAWVYIPV